MRSDRFEWDDRKAELNVAKHGVSFDRATEVFDDPLHASIDDPDHSDDEDRFITIGSTFWEVLVVGHDEELTEDLRPEYDFTGAERGKFHQGRGRLVPRISLDDDVARHYRTTEQVNEALRQMIAEGRAPKVRNE